MFGDFNSRTGTLCDYIIPDEFISEMHGNDILLDENMHAMHCLNKCNIPLNRNTADLTTNTYGHQLIDFCRNNDLFILNGRIGKDAVDPKTTCKDRSTVDYFISSPTCIAHTSEFQVNEFCSLFSDAHCGISISFDTNYKSFSSSLESDVLVYTPNIKLWDQTHGNSFLTNLDLEEITRINNNTDRINEQTDITNKDINNIVTDIELLF